MRSAILAATALWLAARAVDPRLSDALNGGVYDRTAYVLAAVTAGAAGVLLVVWPLQRRCRALEVVAGALVGWSLLALLLAVVLPDAAYAATWPLIAATAGFGFLATRERSPRVTLAAVTLAAVPAVLLLSPLVALYFLLAARFELMLPVATPLPMLWVVLALTLVVPLLLVSRPRVGWRPAAAAGAVAVALAATGVAVSCGQRRAPPGPARLPRRRRCRDGTMGGPSPGPRHLHRPGREHGGGCRRSSRPHPSTSPARRSRPAPCPHQRSPPRPSPPRR